MPTLIPKNGKDQRSLAQIERIALCWIAGSDRDGMGMGSLPLPPLYNAIVNKQSYARRAKSEHEEEQHQRAGPALWRIPRIEDVQKGLGLGEACKGSSINE